MAINQQADHSLSVENTNSNSRGKPTILIFDSGVGGLSVYQEIEKLLPDLHFIYAFDNEGFPYGEKSEKYIKERVVKIVTAVEQQYPLSLAVIACNTASTVSLPPLREQFSFPIVGVVPAIKPAAKLTSNHIVGILATKATVQREYTHELIERFAADAKIVLLGTSELVEIAEDKLHGKPVELEALKRILQPWLLMKEAPDTVVLGCTHFPLLTDELLQVLPAGTRLVDSGVAIARRTAWLLENESELKLSHHHNIAICTSLNDEVMRLKDVLDNYHLFEIKELKLS
ncbi:glutamate racemase [Thorsellia anophelis]|uniref:Glutamate racemase n=1 Tax=Thorsellia anophelis DSM 18579 TaxID=1123402 RepID=A0A1I0E3U2_9GAMM|nr:glutamate racemase [Thorsellia anophelis]SET39554.1 glutamate racemase [Thorsellia anophelis DSM 18579]